MQASLKHVSSAQSQHAENKHDNDDQTYEVDDTIHVTILLFEFPAKRMDAAIPNWNEQVSNWFQWA